MGRSSLRPATALVLLIALALTLCISPSHTSRGHALADAFPVQAGLEVAADAQGFVIRDQDGAAVCSDATPEEIIDIERRDQSERLHVISPIRLSDTGGLKITLRGTAQLEANPAAKAAFLRAATTWEGLIQNPITVIIDVDFGTTRFGNPYPSGVLGSTATQSLLFTDEYSDLRARLMGTASGQAEMALYAALPPGATVPTEIGAASAIVTSSANGRALGLLGPVPDPTAEPVAQFGSPPSIGFNSNFAFDFNPDDGVDPGMTDFDTVATHEIGHALGFISRVGALELSPTTTLALSVWDLFRFRPTVTMGAYATAQRVLSSGGTAVFFIGGAQLQTSTGRPDGTAGDGRQASHWKADELAGAFIGIMDPTVARGQHYPITDNDRAAIDTFGYTLSSSGGGGGGGGVSPSINSLAGNLNGDVLTLTGTAQDPDGDFAQAQITLTDGAGGIVNSMPQFAVNFGSQTTVAYNFQVPGLIQFPAAVRATLMFTDSKGNRSAGVVADFSRADSGGPTLNNVTFDASGAVMVIKGGAFDGQLTLEINGLTAAPPLKIKIKGGGGKLKIGGDMNDLHLHGGANRVRVLDNGLRSNIFVLSL